jgi:general secretion pathway protein D
MLVVLALAPRPAPAQTNAAIASLTGVAISQGSSGETKVLLTFNRALPQFSVVSNDIDQPTLRFESTARGSGAVVPPGAHGLLQAIEFNQHDQTLTVTFVGGAALHIVARPVAGQALSLTLSAAPQAAREPGPAAAGAGLPQFVDRRPEDDTFEVVPLKYADVSEIVGLLSGGQPIRPNDNFTPQEPAFGSQGVNSYGGSNSLLTQTYNQNAQETESAAVGQAVDDTIGVDRRLNAIILRGPPERVARLKEEIAALDTPVQSVVLETVFVELTRTGAKNLGLDFNNSNGQIAVATYQRGPASPNGSVSGGNGLDLSLYGSIALQAAIYDQVQKGEGRIISRPRISAQSGATARIITGDALPILTSIALSGVNAVSQQVQYVNVGVTLQIAPRVSADGYVTSHIFAEVSSVTGTSQGYPTISQREASTSATVKDGDYFVVGGLSQENILTSDSRVGGPGDLPIIGDLFKLRSTTSSKTELYIVVTPHIVRSTDSAEARAEALK